MPDRLMVRPGQGRTVRLQNGRKLTEENTPAAGVLVDPSVYINRRIECGDLVVVPSAPQPAAQAAPQAPATKAIAAAPGAETPAVFKGA